MNWFSEQWLMQAIKIEDEVNCDVEAGFDFGKHAGEYISSVQVYIDQEKLMSVLAESLGNIFQEDELEKLAHDVQNCARERVSEKLKFSKSA